MPYSNNFQLWANGGGTKCWTTNLESSRTPVNKLDSPLGLDCCNRRINIFGHNIPTVQQTASHVLAVSGVTFDLKGKGLWLNE